MRRGTNGQIGQGLLSGRTKTSACGLRALQTLRVCVPPTDDLLNDGGGADISMGGHSNLGARLRILIAAASVAVFVCGTHFSRQLEAQSRSSAAQAIPDLTGIWHRKGPLDGKHNTPAVPTNRAAGFEKAFDEAYNPVYDCSATPIPALLEDDYDFQITQQPDRVIIRYEKMDVERTIWLEGRHPAPAGNDYTTQGHSFGRYEGRRLMITTTKFAFNPTGFHTFRWLPGSTMKKMTERYWREGNTLKLDSVTEDPLSLRQPHRFGWEWTLRTQPLTPYGCDPADSRWGAQWQKSKYPPDTQGAPR